MFHRIGVRVISFSAIVLGATVAWALNFGLSETKDELKLDYTIAVIESGTGRVTVKLAIADDGRLAPISSVQLNVPADDGSGYSDLSLSIAPRNADGKRHYSVHLKRNLAARASIRLMTSTLDGKQTPRTGYFHEIKLAEYLNPTKSSLK
jgi:hypothetical protein